MILKNINNSHKILKTIDGRSIKMPTITNKMHDIPYGMISPIGLNIIMDYKHMQTTIITVYIDFDGIVWTKTKHKNTSSYNPSYYNKIAYNYMMNKKEFEIKEHEINGLYLR